VKDNAWNSQLGAVGKGSMWLCMPLDVWDGSITPRILSIVSR